MVQMMSAPREIQIDVQVEEESQDERNGQERGFIQLRESRTILSGAVGDPSNTEPPRLLSASSNAEERGYSIELINN